MSLAIKIQTIMSKRFKNTFYITFILAVSLTSYAQEVISNTLQFTENTTSPQAALDDVSWIQGHWKGKAFGGITEEIWSPPLGDSMMFVFKLVIDTKVVFSKLVVFVK